MGTGERDAQDPKRRPEEAPGQPTPLRPGDVAPPGTPGTGEDVCPTCQGRGVVDRRPCPECNGTGVVIKGIAGG